MRFYSHMPHPAMMAAMSKKRGSTASTVSLNHFEGADEGTTITDAVAGISWTRGAGAVTDTAAFKFGSTSLRTSTNGVTTYASGFSLNLATSWTIEGFMQWSAASTARWDLGDGVDVGVRVTLIQGTDQVTVGVDNSGTVPINVNPVINTSTMYHFAVTFDGTNYALFFDGNRLANVASAAPTITPSTRMSFLKSAGTGNIWLDEFRLSTAIRYSGATYTVPTAAFTAD